jgi:uncharacterized Zn finger protein
MSNIREKAVRLLANGQVEADIAPATVYRVTGDHGTYTVVVGAHVALCTCPAPGRCSHVEAAVVHANASETEKALIEAAVDRRHDRARRVADDLFARLGA